MLYFDPPIIAHRGASRVAPENTLSAFSKAKQLGANWVEFDVMLCADELVVIHDETLDRTTNGTGYVKEFSYHYLKCLDAGRWFDPKFSGEKIPTLRETLALLTRLGMSANIEIKAEGGQEKTIVTEVLRNLEEYWYNKVTPPLLSSFSIKVLEELRLHSNTVCLGLLMDEWFDNWQELCEELKCISVDVNQNVLTQETILEAKRHHRLLLSYTVNDLTRANDLFNWGVDAVFTDDVALFQETE